jgi:hypothetical protein
MARRAFVAAVIAAALSLAGVGVATAAPPEGSLHLTLVSAGEENLGPRSFAFTDTVYQRGKAVGTSRAVCRFTGNFENPRCRITVSLPAGKLFVFVRLTPEDRGSFRVTGGTGKYQGKTGVGIYRAITDDKVRITAWLTS